MVDILNRVYTWNKERGLLNSKLSIERENSFILSEVMEGFGKTSCKELDDLCYDISCCLARGDENRLKKTLDKLTFIKKDNMTPEKILDSYIDIAIFAIGAAAKVYNSYDFNKDFEVLFKEVLDNNDMKGHKIDDKGKIIK